MILGYQDPEKAEEGIWIEFVTALNGCLCILMFHIILSCKSLP
jgi:hypothetical protein